MLGSAARYTGRAVTLTVQRGVEQGQQAARSVRNHTSDLVRFGKESVHETKKILTRQVKEVSKQFTEGKLPQQVREKSKQEARHVWRENAKALEAIKRETEAIARQTVLGKSTGVLSSLYKTDTLKNAATMGLRYMSTASASGNASSEVKPSHSESNSSNASSSVETSAPSPSGIDWDNLTFKLNPGQWMMVVKGSLETGWEVEIQQRPYGPIELDPAATVLHYGQACFEGMKVVMGPDGQIRIMNPNLNAERMQKTCEALGIPIMSVEQFNQMVIDTVIANRDYVPTGEQGSMYLRPFIFGSGAGIGVAPSSEYTAVTFASPVGPYFGKSGGLKAISLRASGERERAPQNGLGYAKAAGNYAAAMSTSRDAKKAGHNEEVYLRTDKDTIDEAGAANFVLVNNDTKEIISPTGSSVLPGTTLRVIEQLARSNGYTVRREDVRLSEISALMKRGKNLEAFCTGTAAGLAPIGKIEVTIAGREETLVFGNGGVGRTTERLYNQHKSILDGTMSDRRLAQLAITIPGAYRTPKQIVRDQARLRQANPATQRRH